MEERRERRKEVGNGGERLKEAESEGGGPDEKPFQLSRQEQEFISISCFGTRIRIALERKFLKYD